MLSRKSKVSLGGKTCLLVTAHPDDAPRYFMPTLEAFGDKRVKVTVLCMSTGTLPLLDPDDGAITARKGLPWCWCATPVRHSLLYHSHLGQGKRQARAPSRLRKCASDVAILT